MQAGAQILPGETIVMTLSKGPEPRAVPDLAGQTVEAATAAITDLQLVFARGDDVFNDTVPIGQIVTQNPAAGAVDRPWRNRHGPGVEGPGRGAVPRSRRTERSPRRRRC